METHHTIEIDGIVRDLCIRPADRGCVVTLSSRGRGREAAGFLNVPAPSNDAGVEALARGLLNRP